MTRMAMQQAGGTGAAPQELPPNMQQAVDMAARVQAEVQAQTAQIQAQAAAAQAQAQGQAAAAQGGPTAIVRGPDGSIIIRDPKTDESVVIAGDAIPGWLHDGPTTQMVAVPIALFASIAFVIVGLPIARAFGRRMDARNAAQPAVAPSAQLRQLQTSIDTMAVEIERMSEHQRFLTRVLSERTPESLPTARAGEPATRP